MSNDFKPEFSVPYIYVKGFRLVTFFRSCGHLLSRAVSSEVPSAVPVLTVVFGMGTGVSPVRITTGNPLSVIDRPTAMQRAYSSFYYFP